MLPVRLTRAADTVSPRAACTSFSAFSTAFRSSLTPTILTARPRSSSEKLSTTTGSNFTVQASRSTWGAPCFVMNQSFAV